MKIGDLKVKNIAIVRNAINECKAFHKKIVLIRDY